MKKRKLAIIGFIVSLLTLLFITLMLQKRFFIFDDNINAKMKNSLKISMQGFSSELGDIKTKLENFSADDIIVNTLSQFEIGESLEKGVLEIQQVKNSIQFANVVKLISLDGKIVVNTANHSAEGSLLTNEQQRGKIQTTELKLLKNGAIIMAVPCFTKSKRYIGKIIIIFDRKLLLTQFSGMGKKVLNQDYFIYGGAVFYNFSRDFISKNNISLVAANILNNKKSSFTEGNLNILKSIDKKTGLVFVYGLQISQLPLPAIAIVLLILNTLIVISFFILIFLHFRTDKHNFKVNKARESIDILGKEIEENGDYADKIIEETEKMFEKQEQEIAKLKISIAENNISNISEQEVSLSQVMNATGASREFLDSPVRSDLHNIIERVSESPTKINKDNIIGESILNYSTLDNYISELDEVLNSSFNLSKYLIFKKTTSGNFIVQKESGFAGVINDNFMINSNDPVIGKVIRQQKIFFVKRVLANSSYVSNNLKLLQLKNIAQLAFLPVVRDKIVIALVMVFVEEGSQFLTIEKLYELRLLTSL